MVHRCKCGKCVLAHCCLCEPCMEKILEENMHARCFTEHPAFDIGCLNHWVLKLAGLSNKTRIKDCQIIPLCIPKGKIINQSEYFNV